jgi:hypothetical protein
MMILMKRLLLLHIHRFKCKGVIEEIASFTDVNLINWRMIPELNSTDSSENLLAQSLSSPPVPVRLKFKCPATNDVYTAKIAAPSPIQGDCLVAGSSSFGALYPE